MPPVILRNQQLPIFLLLPVTAEGGTDAPATARYTSTSTLMEGRRTDDRGGCSRHLTYYFGEMRGALGMMHPPMQLLKQLATQQLLRCER